MGKAERRYLKMCGVWSPFGEPFHTHGEVMLQLGRKPMPPVAPVPAAASAVAPSPQNIKQRQQQQLPFPPTLHRGLGLGLGLHPQRFPRELLKSSQQRVLSCQAGHTSAHTLAGSKSDPLLHIRIRYAPAFIPSPPPTAQRIEREDGSDDDGNTDLHSPPPPLPMRNVLPKLPLNMRATIGFKSVQRQTRLSLQEALEERQRVRASIYALRHAESAIGPLVLQRREPRFHTRRGAEASAHAPAIERGVKTLSLGSAGKLVPLRTSGSLAKIGLPAPDSSAAGKSTMSALLHGRTSFWHTAADTFSSDDGGRLVLWQTVLEQWEQRKPPPPNFSVEQQRAQVEIGSAFFECLRTLVEKKSSEPLTFDYLEALFQKVGPLFVDPDDKLSEKHRQELIMPLMRAAADCLGLPEGSEGAVLFRRLQLEYATPQKQSPQLSPGRRPSVKTLPTAPTGAASRSSSPMPSPLPQ
jgi:hypothetical protein